ncbi:MAG TPA: hypothetical protein VGE69_04175 [Pseudomonadales bacterium]
MLSALLDHGGFVVAGRLSCVKVRTEMNAAGLAQAFYAALGDRRARWMGSILSVAAILLICRTLYLERGRLAQVDPDRDLLVAATVSVLVVVLGNLLGSTASWLLLRKQAVTLTFPFLVAVNGIAQMAKYLPGNVAHLVGRFFVIKHHTDARAALAFSIYELLLLSLAGCGLGLFYVHFVQRETLALFPVALLSLLFLGAGVLVLLRAGFLKTSLADLSLAVMLYLVSYLCYGLAFSTLFQLVFDVKAADIFLCAVLFALAFVAGYVTPGAPGGLGVREFVFMVLAQPFIDTTLAVSVVVMFRLFSVAGDLVFSIAALSIKKVFDVKLLP